MAATIPTNGLGVDAGLDIAGGNLTFTTADKGVHLGVTSATAANLLDDFEEGTFTPSITAGFYAMNGYQTLSGRYVKIGRQVHVTFYYYTAASGWTSNGLAIQLGGLPFTQVNETGARGQGLVTYTTMAAYTAQVYGNPNSTTVTLYRDGSTGFARGSNHTEGNAEYIIGGFSYEAA